MDKWRENNKEKSNDCFRRYRQTKGGKFKEYERNARYRNLNFSITIEEFLELWGKPCTYCGEEIETIGIDRIDSNIGYEKDNIIPCCTDCNKMKSNRDTESFLLKIKKIYTHTIT